MINKNPVLTVATDMCLKKDDKIPDLESGVQEVKTTKPEGTPLYWYILAALLFPVTIGYFIVSMYKHSQLKKQRRREHLCLKQRGKPVLYGVRRRIRQGPEPEWSIVFKELYNPQLYHMNMEESLSLPSRGSIETPPKISDDELIHILNQMGKSNKSQKFEMSLRDT